VEYASTPAERGGGASRALAVVLFLILLLGAAIMIIAAADIAGTTLCSDVTLQDARLDPNGECFDGSSIQKVVSVALGFASGAVGVIAALLAIAYTFTGRRGRLVVIGTVAAVVLAGASILVGSL
jgi:hypothetical protein